MTPITRRNFLIQGLCGSTLVLVPGIFSGPKVKAATAPSPHFFLQLYFRGGIDSSYLFDARPLEMTNAGKIQNFLGAEPEEWAAIDGQKTLCTSLVSPLRKYQNDLSIINGVFMSADFNGHEQNLNILFSGSVLGGESYVPHLNAGNQYLIDSIVEGQFPHWFTNSQSVLHITNESVRSLIDRSNLASTMDLNSPLFQYVNSRYKVNSAGTGSFSLTSQNFVDALSGVPALATQLHQTKLNSETGFLPVVREFFKTGISHSALLCPQVENIDAHTNSDAKAQPVRLASIVSIVDEILSFLKSTPYDENQSLFDVTTFVLSSEMSRTMRQENLSMDNTGTDHNCFSNSIVLAGKGIKGGYVIGESDFRSSAEVLSKAHLAIDPTSLKAMGKPFDFKTYLPLATMPAVFAQSDYLNVGSVVNTIYKLFGVPVAKFRTDSLGLALPTIDKILI